MKKAIIRTGGKQYIVAEGDELLVDLLNTEAKTVEFEVLSVIDGDKTTVGSPVIAGAKVTADVIMPLEKMDKVLAIRYKAKKRVHKVHGHRQQMTRVKVGKIA